MKSRVIMSLVVLALVSVSSSVTARSTNYERRQSDLDKAFTKLGRGVVNVLTCWVEWPSNVATEWERTDPITGMVVGSVKGISWGFARFATGVFETFTFPFPVPAGYEPMMLPEYIISDTWGDTIPGITEFGANDPMYSGEPPTYPQQFRF